MQDFNIKMQDCIYQAKNCFYRIKALQDNRFELPDAVDFFCFRVGIRGSDFSISISFPPDMMFGKYETALFKNDDLIYKEEWGYHDIKRFDSFYDLLEELNNIHDFIQKKQI